MDYGTYIMDDGTDVKATSDNPVTMSYTASTESKSTNESYMYETTNFNDNYFWLASRALYLHSNLEIEPSYMDYCNYYVRYVWPGHLSSDCLYESYGRENNKINAVLPVVSLKSNIQTSGQDENGAWNLIVK